MNMRIGTTTKGNVISCVVLGVILFLLLHTEGLILLAIFVGIVEGGRYAYRRVRPARVERPISDEELAATIRTRRS